MVRLPRAALGAAICFAPSPDASIVGMDGRRRQIASNWFAFGLSILLIATIVASRISVSRRPHATASKVMIGTRDEVYYYRPVTMEQATTLGHALENTGFFADQGMSVLLSRNKGVPVVSFVLRDGAWDRPGSAATFEEIGRHVATSIGGFPIQVHLVDAAWTVRKSLTVGKTAIGSKDAVYYFGSATEADAKALGQALRDAGYLQDLGVSVAVSKDDGTAIEFVVSDGVWDRPAAVAAFENLARKVAGSIGGLPVQLRLLNAQMETRKEAKVQ
jgi:hypothetical protein